MHWPAAALVPCSAGALLRLARAKKRFETGPTHPRVRTAAHNRNTRHDCPGFVAESEHSADLPDLGGISDAGFRSEGPPSESCVTRRRGPTVRDAPHVASLRGAKHLPDVQEGRRVWSHVRVLCLLVPRDGTVLCWWWTRRCLLASRSIMVLSQLLSRARQAPGARPAQAPGRSD